MPRAVTIAMTETRNAFQGMPQTLDALDSCANQLEEIRAANVSHHVALIERAQKEGAQIVGLGEMFTGPYFALSKNEFWRGLAESAESGRTVLELAQVAKRLSVVIVAPIYELDANSNQRFNTAVVIDSTGELLGKYRKTHIPNGSNEQNTFHELFYFGPSDGACGTAGGTPDCFPVFETQVARIGVAICYDRHFEGVMRSLAHAGAEIVFSPAVTFGEKSRRLWQMEYQVDAVRNRIFIAGSNRLGSEAPWNQEFFGESHVAGPNGLIECTRTLPGLVIATLDLDTVRHPDPSGWKLVEDRRPDIYTR